MKIIRRIIALLLIPAFLVLCACGSMDDNEDNESTEQVKYTVPAGLTQKNETVYINLANDGTVTQTIVSDWIHTDRSEVYVNDITDLQEIENIKDDSIPDVTGSNLKWYMNSTDLYYQGKSQKKAPVSFNISYKLNGEAITAEELVGKSGEVEINIVMNNNDASNVKVNGKTVTMYNPLIVVGGLSLPESKFQNISVKNGRITANGNTQLAVLVGFPGINKSLGLTTGSSNGESYAFDDTFTISAFVTDFELSNIMFSAIPIASLDIGLNNISNSMDDVRDNLSKLQSIQKTLQSIDANGLMNTLSSNPNKVKELSSLVESASNLYENNKALINVLNKYATNENMNTIQFLVSYISQADYEGLESALAVINSFFGDDASSEKIQEGLVLLKAMSDDLKNPEVQAAIQNLDQTVSTISALKSAIDNNKDLIDALKVISQSNALSSLDTALSGLEGSLAVGGLSQYTNITGNADEITAKMTAWIELGKKYTIFTKKLDSMDSSVMFIYKVDAIKKSTINSNYNSDESNDDSDIFSDIYNKIFG